MSFKKVGIGHRNREEAKLSDNKWFPYNKGGDYRRWYGNQDVVINYENDGEEIKKFHDYLNKTSPGGRLKNQDFYFKNCISWSKISSGMFAVRFFPEGFIFDVAGSAIFFDNERDCFFYNGLLNSFYTKHILSLLSPTLNFEAEHLCKIPVIQDADIEEEVIPKIVRAIEISKWDWESYETSWNFTQLIFLNSDFKKSLIKETYQSVRNCWRETASEMQSLEYAINRSFIDAYGLNGEMAYDLPLSEISLTSNPYYRYHSSKGESEAETLLQCDSIEEMVSFAVGCMMGRYSLDKPGLILASQGEILQDYLNQVPDPRFVPDDDAILPLTNQEWFPDDATNRFSEFIRKAWDEEHLQENFDFVAESLCLHAIRPKRDESALETIRRYLSTQFYKDHLSTYKRRPIYWLFSSGKHKAFECLVYLHRYNEGTLARMRTEYVIPLSARFNAYAEKLEQDKDASSSTAETKRLEKEIATLHKQQTELAEFDEKLRHYADQRISLDLDDGVKGNYGKFGDLLAEVKAVTGEK